MTLQEIAQDILHINLAPFLPHREIEILTHSLNQKFPNTPAHQPSYEEGAPLEIFVTVLQDCLAKIKKNTKNKQDFLTPLRRPGNPYQLSEPSLLYLELLRLQTHEFFILLALTRYRIPISILGITLQQSEDSILFQHQRLLNALDHHLTQRSHPGNSYKVLTSDFEPLILELKSHSPHSSTNTFIYKKFNYNTLPLPVKYSLELLAGFVVFGALIWSIPKIRKSYESSLNKKINEHLMDYGISDAPAPLGLNPPSPSTEVQASGQTSDPSTEETPETLKPQQQSSPKEKKQPKVTSGETWRFSFTGVAGSTNLESEVQTTLEKTVANIVTKKSTVPGGIQIEAQVSVSSLIPIKSSLEDIVFKINQKNKNGNETTRATSTELNLSWYKKNMTQNQKINKGQVLVIIWISTL